MECCERAQLEKDEDGDGHIRRCSNIRVDRNDPEFKGINGCFPFTRWSKSKDLSVHSGLVLRSDIFCPQQGKPREQINGITAFIDGSSIYGSDAETSNGLREHFQVPGRNGRTLTVPGPRLKTQNKGEGKGKEALPSRGQCGFGSPQESTRVPKPNPTPEDLTSGDSRAIVQPTLTSMHTLFLQEHNRIVDALLPLWNAHTDTKRLSPHTREDFIFEVGSFGKVVRNLFRTRHSKMCKFCIWIEDWWVVVLVNLVELVILNLWYILTLRLCPACEKAGWSWAAADHLPRVSPGCSRQESSWQPRRQGHRIQPNRWSLHSQWVRNSRFQVIIEKIWKFNVWLCCQVWPLNHTRWLPRSPNMAVAVSLLWVS